VGRDAIGPRVLKLDGIEDLEGDTATIRFSDTVLNEPINSQAWEVAPRD